LSNAQQNTQIHVHCYLQLKLLENNRVDLLLDGRNDVTRNNEQVEKNTRILRRLPDVACTLSNQEYPFRGHDESSTSLNKVNFMEFRSVLKNHCPLLENHQNSATVI